MSQSIEITLMYFASLADKANIDSEQLTIDNSISLPQLYQQVASKYGFQQSAEQLRVAINHNFADWTDKINEGDSIAFIPPVAGG